MMKEIQRAEHAADLASLSPERRALLALRLKKQGGKFNSFPLSFAQERLWFLDQLEPGNTIYNVYTAVRLKGQLDAAMLERAFNEIVRRHENLRTRFVIVEGQPVQVVSTPRPFALPVINLSGVAEDEREARAIRLVMEEVERPFDLARSPLLNLALIQLRDDDHIALFTTHHILFDGWSRGVLIRELAALYQAFSRGLPSPLPELPIQYADYAVWQRQWLHSAAYEKQLSYWKRQLSGSDGALRLPTDHPRPQIQTFRGATRLQKLSRELSDKLKALSRREDTTLFMTLLAGFKTLLYRYTGQEDLVIGTAIANRNRIEIEGLIGFFVNTLVLRTDLTGNPSFRELLGRVREVALGAYAHQDLPFERLVDELQTKRDLSHSPLFQTMFSLQNIPTESLELPGITLSALEVESTTTKFDLALTMFEDAEGLIAAMQYNTDLFEEASVKAMLEHFEVLLGSAAGNPDERISWLPLLTGEQQQQLLSGWYGNEEAPSTEQSVTELFEAQAEQTPDADAVVFGDSRLAYGELNARANQLARHLLSLGVGPESLVGICLERSAEMAVCILAILKAGAAYLPLDPEHPCERLRFILEDAAPAVLLTQKSLKDAIPETGARLLFVDIDWAEIARGSKENLRHRAGDDTAAYLIYTSGSTGTPKAVIVERRHLSDTIQTSRHKFGFKARDIMPCLAPFSFDISLFELLTPLTAGATARILSRDDVLNGEVLLDLLDEITLLHAVPSLMRQIVDLVKAGETRKNYEKIRAIFVGGDAVPGELLREMQVVFPSASIHVLYGPTEGTIICAASTLSDLQPPRANLIGSPLPKAALRLCNHHLQLLPAGVPGELFIGGRGVARGYLHRPDLTAERFIPDPFSPTPGARLYRTGDLARVLPDGRLQFMGRIDHQIKLRGFRIELGEVEAALRQHACVRDAAVVVREDVPGDRRLTAYLVMDEEQKLTAGETRRFLEGRLPYYMIPSAFLTLNTLPLSPNGKLDRRALPAPGEHQPASEETFAAPRTPAEETLAAIWARTLRLKEVGVHDNFFELGGDSILSIQVVARANEAGLRLTPKQLFQHQTIAELAKVAGVAAASLVSQEEVVGPVPLTPIQHRFFMQNIPDANHFNQAVLLEIVEAPDDEQLRRAVRALVVHHDALRMRFNREADGWRQFNAAYDDDAQVPFESVDLSDLPEAGRRPAMEEAAAQTQTSLDLGEGPLLRVKLFRLGEGTPCRLLFVVHHLVVDGVSWRVLLEDLQTAYRQLVAGQAIKLPSKTTSFRQWAYLLKEHAQSESVYGEMAHWTSQATQDIRPLPVDHPGGRNTSDSARAISVALSVEETTALLQEVPAAYHTQIQEVLLTALAQTFSAWTGTGKLLVEMEGHGRESVAGEADISRTVGWFTTLFPAVLEAGKDDGPGGALKSVKEQLRRIPNNGIGYGLLRYLNDNEGVARELLRLPQAEVSFNYLGQADQVLAESSLFEFASESSGLASSLKGDREYLIEVSGVVAGGQLHLQWKYSANLHREETAERAAHAFVENLRALIAHCLSPQAGGFTPSDFPLARLDQRRLDQLCGFDRNVEDVFPLSAMQQGLLFHTLYAPESGVYIVQVTCTLDGVNVPAFKRAWQQVVGRHAVMRTALLWKRLDKPLQIVYHRVRPSWEEQDWNDLTPDARRERLDSFIQADRDRSFDFSQAPLTRFALLRLDADSYAFVWSFHHLVLDGWSVPLVLREVFAFYRAICGVDDLRLERRAAYRDYIEWLQQQDQAKAEAYWRGALKGFATPTPLGPRGRADANFGEALDYKKIEVHVPATVTKALRSLAQERQLTLNTVVQGAWAVALSDHSKEEDVLYGTIVSGRSADLPGIEAMVGLFINALPVRVRVSPPEATLPWLKRLQEQHVEMRQYEHTPLVDIRRWSEVGGDQPLFESVFVFENYPLDEALAEGTGGIGVGNTRITSPNSFPLTIHVHPRDPELVLQLIYEPKRFDHATMARLLDNFVRVLAAIAARPEASLSELKGALRGDEGKREMRDVKREPAVGKRFKRVKPKGVDLSRAELIKTDYLALGQTLPLVMRPGVAGCDLADWAAGNRQLIEGELVRHGAILFRGFDISSPADFERFASTLCPELFNENGEHPRQSVSGNIYTPVFYPSEQQLLWHNENSYNLQWPMKIWFCCLRPPQQGGETPIVDSRRVYDLIMPEIRERFERKKVMYVRNYGLGLGLNWQTVFRTTSREEVERRCRNTGTTLRWKDDGSLKTISVRPSVLRHPVSGEISWFNQAQHWHVSFLDPATRESLLALFKEEDFPRNCYYGDGSPIEDSVMQEIKGVYQQLEVVFPWQVNDVLMLDNVLAAHGRNPFKGERKLLVAMGQMSSYQEV